MKTVVASAGAMGATAGATAACSKSPEAPVTEASAPPTAAETPPPAQASEVPVPVPVIEVQPLRFPWQTADPFLFCAFHDDEYPRGDGAMGPDASLSGRQLGSDFSRRDGWSMYHGRKVPGFPRHPHRGFETVTVVRQGLCDHSDSLGATARYGGGDAQWMTAGGGIVHSEMFPLLDSAAPNPLELFQIWLNLPKADKMVEAHFKMLWREQIPVHSLSDAAGNVTRVTTIAGTLDDTKAPPSPPPKSWAARPGSHVAIWVIEMGPNATWTLPAAAPSLSRSLYFHEGPEIHMGDQRITANQRVILRSDAPVPLGVGASGGRLLLLQGKPLGEPVAHRGPFVMNDRQELQQAYADYQRTQFGGWPWQSDAPVHSLSQPRFALHPDGRRDEPA